MEETDEGDEEKSVSFCLLDSAHFEVIHNNEEYLYLLGVHYKYNRGVGKESVGKTILKNFCYALCEKSRINILLFLLERGEVTCKDLEREFSLSGSTAYHHISIMSRNGIVSTRTKGKSVFYSINNEMFDQVYTFLRNFI